MEATVKAEADHATMDILLIVDMKVYSVYCMVSMRDKTPSE
jgi:hypothetical protein